MSDADNEKKAPTAAKGSKDAAAKGKPSTTVATKTKPKKAAAPTKKAKASADAEATAPKATGDKLVRDEAAEEKLKATSPPRDRRNLILGLVGAAAFIGVTLVAGLLISNYRPTFEEAAPAAIQEQASKPILSVPELLQLGREAIKTEDFETAQAVLEDARVQSSSSDTSQQIEIFGLLAEVAETTGDSNVADIYRGYLAKLRAELGTSLEVFSEAEAARAKGEQDQALKLYSAFILRSGELEGEARIYLNRAREEIAAIWMEKYRASEPARASLSKEKASYFDG
ncbi:MAG: hypothetical protein V3W41_03830 [Planctomycetota bacterium]